MMGWAEHSESVARTLSLDFSLAEAIGRLGPLVRSRAPVHLLLVGVREGAFEKLPLRRSGTVDFRLLAEGSGARVIEAASHAPEDSDYPRVVFRLDATRDARVAFLVTVAPNAAWKAMIERFVRSAYPRLFPVFLRQHEVRGAFEGLQSVLPSGERLMLTKASQLRRLTHSVSRRRFSSERTWTDAPFAEAFADARDQQVFFKRAWFEVCRMKDAGPQTTGVDGSVSVNGYLTTSGLIPQFFASAAEAAFVAVRREAELAHDRARQPGNAVAKPLVAVLEEPITREQLPRVAAALRKMTRTSVSVLHGNPYLHARVVDFTDGSAFDVMLVSPNELVIVPHLRATEGAVTRLCQHVYENIGEAEFRDGAGEGT